MLETYLINFCPKSVLQPLFGLTQLFVVSEHVKMGEDAHYFWETVHLAYIEKLKCLHFKTKTCIYKEQNLKKLK
jgi:CTP:phosphocholine cytidylyltransferase-like protein